MKTYEFRQLVTVENVIVVNAENEEQAQEVAIDRWNDLVPYNNKDFKFISEETLDFDIIEIDDKQHSVFVGGTEVNDYMLSKKSAELLASEYIQDGYTDVSVEKISEVKS